jgi:fluoride exporter
LPVAFAVAIGGTLGALARYGLDRAIERRVDSLFPWSTFAINISGCFAVGLVVAALVDRHDTPAWVRVGLTVGFLGAYTTFSTFAQESLDLGKAGYSGLAVTYAVASVAVGVVFVYAGTAAGRML